jgi:magnesium-transporting ATPase (P-type)
MGDLETDALAAVAAPHALSSDDVVSRLRVSRHGLTIAEAAVRLQHFGHNILPKACQPGVLKIFLHQFRSPLIYVLLAAALLSLIIQEWADAGFISAVLSINALIGTIQEYSAQHAASALQEMVTTHSRVLRESDTFEIEAQDLVPGDILLLESGDKVPADVRLTACHDLEVDESALTGESLPVLKNPNLVLAEDTFLGDRSNTTYAGTVVARGRGRGVVVATGTDTELGHIATDVLTESAIKAPLVLRMERFTQRIAIIVVIAALIMSGIALSRGMPLTEIFLLAVALAVSAIPEGLPVALTVALAIGMRRMAKRNVIIRKLVAVEALGSCTFIATDKTGTLTVNQLTANRIAIAAGETWEVSSNGTSPEGRITTVRGALIGTEEVLLARICRAAVLANEGFIGHRDGGWAFHGDAVDIALLTLARKAGIVKAETLDACPELATIPFESERLFSASLNQVDHKQFAFVKGAIERVLPMCSSMATPDGDLPLAPEILMEQVDTLASDGYRVLALVAGPVTLTAEEDFSEEHLEQLVLLGLVGMIDPLRTEAIEAVASCRDAGIEVAMITGDHATTALAISQELSLADDSGKVITGPELDQAGDVESLDRLVRDTRVFARVAPHQKLDIVQSLQRSGHYVAVSGDGANDAPALRASQVGIAMGRTGTDVARETADLIITDDNFASIVAGIEEGRVAYANVRKVIFLLISTGAAELVLFMLALITGQPLPLLAVQLLWLNLVTNGIQDVALAFEPAEGDELRHPPRSPRESIFNRLMIERVLLSALVIGVIAFTVFQWLLTRGFSLDEARNGTLLLMVLFENIHVFNSRSETRSVFQHSPLGNPILLIGTAAAQLIHIAAMYTPWLSDVLRIQPVSLAHWLELLGLAFSVLIVMELHKAIRSWYGRRPSNASR